VVFVRIIGITFLLEKGGELDGVHGLIGVHRPLLQPRQPEQDTEQKNKDPEDM